MDNDNGKGIWIASNLACLGIYAAASYLCLTGASSHIVVWAAALILIAHVLEVPLAFHQLKDRTKNPLKVVVATILFGLTWWIPAKRGIYNAA